MRTLSILFISLFLALSAGAQTVPQNPALDAHLCWDQVEANCPIDIVPDVTNRPLNWNGQAALFYHANNTLPNDVCRISYVVYFEEGVLTYQSCLNFTGDQITCTLDPNDPGLSQFPPGYNALHVVVENTDGVVADPLDLDDAVAVAIFSTGTQTTFTVINRSDFGPQVFDFWTGTGTPKTCTGGVQDTMTPIASLTIAAQCADGVDNDGDGGIDWNGTPPDAQCTGPSDNRERGGCGLGFELAFLLPGLMWFHRRRNS